MQPYPKMVHLNRVATDNEVESENLNGDFSTIKLEDYGDEEYTTTVYGSRHAATDLPRHEMPEKEMPAQIAYRLIKDDLTLDGVCDV